MKDLADDLSAAHRPLCRVNYRWTRMGPGWLRVAGMEQR